MIRPLIKRGIFFSENPMTKSHNGKTNLHARVSIGTAQKLKAIAKKHDLIYSGDGSISQLMDAIARGELKIIRNVNH